MNNRIIWVFGGSGAGKETFINNLSNHQLPQTEKILDLNYQEYSVCKESLE